jgi:hypothetical protein
MKLNDLSAHVPEEHVSLQVQSCTTVTYHSHTVQPQSLHTADAVHMCHSRVSHVGGTQMQILFHLMCRDIVHATVIAVMSFTAVIVTDIVSCMYHGHCVKLSSCI